MFLAYLLAFSVGFLSLGQEILWIRLFSFANQSLPQAFAFVLTAYLIGIAFGAIIGKKLCHSAFNNLWIISGLVLCIASFFDLVSPWIYVGMSQSLWQISCGGFLIMLTALLKSIIFPIAHHLGSPSEGAEVGRAVSKVYVSNIIGATLGPMVVGMILLEFFSTQQCFAILAGLTFMVGFCCVQKRLSPLVSLSSLFMAFFLLAIVFTRESSHLMKMASAQNPNKIHQMIETRQGVVTVYQGKNEDIIFGNNIYDGRTNLDPICNSNGINRAIILAAIAEKPERVLMIGLSIGTWLKILTSFPSVKKIDVVEINPGYLTAIENYPRQRSALQDARVRIYIQDARRWLKDHPNNKYDLVIMNASYYWRVYASNLLSREFLSIMKQHLNPGALVAYNSTSSPDVLKTATDVFLHAYLYQNFVIAADFDWREKYHDPVAAKKLAELFLDGKPLFPSGSEGVIQNFLTIPINKLKMTEEFPVEVITDNNLVTEYRHGRPLWKR